MDLFRRSEATRVVDEVGAIGRLGAIVRELGGSRVLLVTDPGIVAAGHVERAEAALSAAGIAHARFAEVEENPTTRDAERCLEAAREFGPDLFCGLGGGSAIDVAKGGNFLFSCGGRMQDYRGFGKASAPLLPLVAVPTTAGTGTEVQSFALIADEATHEKMACGDASATPRVALLDGALTLTMPPRVTAYTGLDAIGHAVESAVTTRRNARSAAFAHEAFRRAAGAFPRVLEQPGDLDARCDMLRAAALAGLAIENSMLGAAHSMANPLTRHFGLAHGQAVGTALPAVVDFNAEDEGACAIYAELAWGAGLAPPDADARAAAAALGTALRGFLAAAGVPLSLAELGVGPGDLRRLAREAAEQWTAGFNPRPVDAAAFEALFTRAGVS